MRTVLAVVPLLAAALAAYMDVTGSNRFPILQKDDMSRLEDNVKHQESSEWPYGPFSTKGRDIINTRGDVIRWAGINWPSHRKSQLLPSGLEAAHLSSWQYGP